MAAAEGPIKLITERLREALFLEQAQRVVESRAPEVTARVREFAAAADTRLTAAEALAASDQMSAAFVILRDAAILAARAVLEMEGTRTEDGGSNPLDTLADQIGGGTHPRPPEGFARAHQLLTDPNPLAFDDLSRAEAIQRRADVEATVSWLRGQIEARSLRQIKISRGIRLGVVGLAIVGSVASIVGWGASRLLSAKNLALHKPVTMSSRRPFCPGSAGAEGLPPSGLVDGSHGGTYDICSGSEVNPWAVVDLGEIHVLNKTKLYNRDDCCWGQYDLPVVIELSTDGKDYVEVGRQTTAYTGSAPWTLSIDSRPARYVRVRVDNHDPKELVLTELEVFGR